MTGPDEYSAIADDNTYTNLMAARNPSYAADAARRWPVEAARRQAVRRNGQVTKPAVDTRYRRSDWVDCRTPG